MQARGTLWGPQQPYVAALAPSCTSPRCQALQPFAASAQVAGPASPRYAVPTGAVTACPATSRIALQGASFPRTVTGAPPAVPSCSSVSRGSCPGACSDDALKAAQIARGLSTTSVVVLHGLEKPGAGDSGPIPRRQQHQFVRGAEPSEDLWNLILERTNRLLASVGVEPDMSECRHSVQTQPETAGTPSGSSPYSQEELPASAGGSSPQLDYHAMQRSPLLLPPAVRRPPVGAERGSAVLLSAMEGSLLYSPSRSSSPASCSGGAAAARENASEVALASAPSSCSARERAAVREQDLEDELRSGDRESWRNCPDSPDSSGWYYQGTDSCGMIRMSSVGSFRRISNGHTTSCDSFSQINYNWGGGGSAVIAVAPRISGAQSEGDQSQQLRSQIQASELD